MYSSISASFIAPRPIARRAENPVPTPKSIRPGASPFSVAKALAVTAAMRFDGTSTPVPSRMREVFSAAAAIETKQSAVIICVSKNQACVKPSASAFCAIFHESLALGMPTPKSMLRLLNFRKRAGRKRAGWNEQREAHAVQHPYDGFRVAQPILLPERSGVHRHHRESLPAEDR